MKIIYLIKTLLQYFPHVGSQTNDKNQFPLGKLSRNDESLQSASILYQICCNEKSLWKIYQLYTGLYFIVKADGTTTGNFILT
jgi:hypothetical protein